MEERANTSMIRGTRRAVALAAVALAITPPLASAALRPGTPAKPNPVRLMATFGWNKLGEDVTSFSLWFPNGSVYNGARLPKCSAATLAQNGPTACPPGSIVGSGTGTAYADTTITRPQITVVNGGGSTVYFYTVLNNPARVQEPIVGHVTRLHGRFVYELSATIPQNLQVVAGVPINLTSLTITAGKGNWIALGSAPAGIKVQTGYANGATNSYELFVQNL